MQLDDLDEDALCAAAEALGKLLAPGHVLLLEGSMGAGKTTFTRALARGLGVHRPERVCSPTFNLCLVHSGPTPLVHVDLFRLAELGDPSEPPSAAFEALGLEALVDRLIEARGVESSDLDPPTPVLVIEWADLWKDADRDALRIRLQRDGRRADRRRLEASAQGDEHRELLERWAAAVG